MIRLLLIIAIFNSMFVDCFAKTLFNDATAIKSHDDKSIGGWSPMFFTSYDESGVKKIIEMVHHKKIYNIKISYPSSQKKLAKEIKDQIEKDTLLNPSMYLLHLKDTPTTRYVHNQVVLTLYYSRQSSNK
ncbi:MAG: hypothetical protein ACK5Z5_01720 [Neisseriaceae bacterium]